MAVMADKLRKVVIPVHKRDIPGPIHYMPQRTRRPWRADHTASGRGSNGGDVGHSVFPGRFGRRIVHVIIPGPQG